MIIIITVKVNEKPHNQWAHYTDNYTFLNTQTSSYLLINSPLRISCVNAFDLRLQFSEMC